MAELQAKASPQRRRSGRVAPEFGAPAGATGPKAGPHFGPPGGGDASLAGAGLFLVLGLAGLGLSWRLAASVLGWPAWAGEGLLLAAALLAWPALWSFAATTISTLWLTEDAETGSGGRGVVAAAVVPLAALLFAEALAPYQAEIAGLLWRGGAVAQLVGLVLATREAIVRAENGDAATAASPLWLLPPIGCLAAPLAGTRLGGLDFSWFLFAVGIASWLALTPLVLHRLFCVPVPLPPTRKPEVFLLLGPPGVGALAFTALGHTVADEPARLLVAICFFTALVLLALASRFLTAPFTDRWAVAPFPAAALSAVGLLFHDAFRVPLSHWLAVALLLGASLLTALVGVGLAVQRWRLSRAQSRSRELS